MTNEIDFKKGTVAITATIKKSSDPDVTMFNFFEYKSSEGEISLKLKNKNELTFTHRYKNKINIIIYDFTEYFDMQNQIVVTWSLESKELNLYINGELKQKEEI